MTPVWNVTATSRRDRLVGLCSLVVASLAVLVSSGAVGVGLAESVGTQLPASLSASLVEPLSASAAGSLPAGAVGLLPAGDLGSLGGAPAGFSVVALGLLGLAAPAGAERDVERLIEGVDRVAEGEYDVEFDLDRDDELGRLGDALDRMTDAVGRREGDLEDRIDYTDHVLDAIDDVFYVLDRQGEHRRWNQTLADVTGYDHEEIAEMHPLDHFEGEATERIAAGIDEAFETGDARAEADLQTESGEVIPYEWSASRLTAPDGTPVVAGIGRDVSERVATERQLERTRDLFEQSQRLAGIGGCEITLPGRELTVTEEFCRIVGRPPEADLELTDVIESFHPEDRQRVEAALDSVLEDGQSCDLEARLVTAEGTERWVHAIGEPVHGGGEVVAMRGSIQDVTERRERERRLEQYRTVTEAASDVIVTIDGESRIQSVNPAVEDVFGYEPDALVGESLTALMPADLADGHREAVERYLETGERTLDWDYLELPGEHADGSEIPLAISFSEVEHLGERYFTGIVRDVSERQERERELRERERRLERYKQFTDDILDSMDDLFYVVGHDLTLQRWNRAMCEATGYTDEEIAEMRPIEFVVEEDTEIIADSVQEVFETGSARDEARVRTKDGDAVPYEFVGSLLEDPEGNQVLVGVGRDVSERKERERKLEALVENTTNAIYIKDCEGRYTFANEAAASYFDASPEALLGKRDEELIDEGAPAATRETDEHILETGETITEEVERTVGGETYVFLDNRYPYRDESGEIIGVMGISRDITGRKRRERRIQETNARLEAIIEASPDALIAVDSEGTVELWNPAAERIFGWSAEEVVGEPLPFVPEDRTEEMESLLERVQGGETLSGVETRRRTSDGDLVDVSLSAAPLRDSDGEVVGVMAAIEDVTERKTYERELETRSAAIEESIDGIAILDRNQRYTFVNQAHAEIYGYDDPEPFLGSSWQLCYDDEEVERLDSEALPELFEEGAWRGEALGLRTDGTTFPQELSLTVLEDGRTICVVRDVSERKERERELERTRNLLEQAQHVARVGGWELDVRSEPYTFEGTDEFYDIHGVSPKSEFDTEMALSFYHPEDRERVRGVLTEAIETGTSYDMEARLSTAADQQRWIRAIAEPVFEGEEVVALRGSIQDITGRKEQELTLQSLHEVARGLLEAESTSEVADLVVDAAADVLDLACIGVYLLDDDSGRLEPAAVSERFESACVDATAGLTADGDSVLWDVYVAGTARSLDEEAIERSQFTSQSVNGGVLVPVGDYGVLVAASVRDTVQADDRRVAETLVATMETALHRIDSETDLREREAELEARNRRLRRQMQITEIIRRVDESLVGATTREEVESAVCERLVESEDVAFAWIGALDPQGETLEPRAWAGGDHEYLDAISLETASESTDPAVETAVTGESAVVESVVEGVKDERWRKHALVRDFSSVVTVPLRFDEVSYGVLAVYGTEPDAFGELERTVFEELGEGIANSINALEARHALYTDAFVELRLRLDGEEGFLGLIAEETGARVEYVGLATHTEEESRLFFEADGVKPEAVRDALEARHAVRDHRLISEADEPDLFEATVAGEVLAAKLISRGGVPRSMTAEAGQMEVVVDVPTRTDVREFVEMLRERYPSVEMVARRDVQRDVQTRQELVTDLFEELTDRQVEVLRTAFFAGFFEWPRESTGQDVADLLDVSQPTVNRHLRHGLARLMEQLFEEEPATLAEA